MMTRKNFLITLLSGGAVWSLGRFGRSSKEVAVYSGYLAGVGYYDWLHVIREIKEGEAIGLKREPGNKHDTRAIEVMVRNWKLGYIRRADNQVLANLMDANIALNAKVVRLSPEGEDWKKVKIEVTLNS